MEEVLPSPDPDVADSADSGDIHRSCSPEVAVGLVAGIDCILLDEERDRRSPEGEAGHHNLGEVPEEVPEEVPNSAEEEDLRSLEEVLLHNPEVVLLHNLEVVRSHRRRNREDQWEEGHDRSLGRSPARRQDGWQRRNDLGLDTPFSRSK